MIKGELIRPECGPGLGFDGFCPWRDLGKDMWFFDDGVTGEVSCGCRVSQVDLYVAEGQEKTPGRQKCYIIVSLTWICVKWWLVYLKCAVISEMWFCIIEVKDAYLPLDKVRNTPLLENWQMVNIIW